MLPWLVQEFRFVNVCLYECVHACLAGSRLKPKLGQSAMQSKRSGLLASCLDGVDSPCPVDCRDAASPVESCHYC